MFWAGSVPAGRVRTIVTRSKGPGRRMEGTILMGDNAFTRRNFIVGAGVAAGMAAAAATGVGTGAQGDGAAHTALAATSGADQASILASSVERATYAPDWLGEEPQIDDAQITKTVTADIVVMGGGNAGSMCAFAAAEEGSTVAVIEQQEEDSVFYYGLHDIASLNSQMALDLGVDPIDPTDFLIEFQRRAHNRTNPRLVKQFADNSGEMIDWLAANLDPEVAEQIVVDTSAQDYAAYEEMGREVNGFKCWFGTLQVNYNAGAAGLIAKADGATWYWGHTGVKVEVERGTATQRAERTASDGTVEFYDAEVPHTVARSVIATDPDGNYVRFVANKAVVLAGGDYGGNAAMYADLQDEKRWLWRSHGLDISQMRCAGFGRDGSGIKMALWAGGTMDPNVRCLVDPQVMFASDTYASNVLRWGASFQPAENPWGAPFVWFDQTGRRFTDECFMGVFGQRMRAERSRPGRYYVIFDSHWKELMSREAPEHFAQPMGKPGNFNLEETFDAWLERGAQGAETNEGDTVSAWAAQTLDELLLYMPLEDDVRGNIKAEIERYNEFCANGKDEDFGRDPKMLLPVDQGPFFGFYCVEERPMTGTCTLNGVNIDENQAVLDENYNPIENLYATGNNSGGRFAIEYSAPMSGLTIGFAMTLGRILGKRLAGE